MFQRSTQGREGGQMILYIIMGIAVSAVALAEFMELNLHKRDRNGFVIICVVCFVLWPVVLLTALKTFFKRGFIV